MFYLCLVKPIRAVLRCVILEERGSHSSQTEPLREWIVDMTTETHTHMELPGDKYVVVKNRQIHVNERNLRDLFQRVREGKVTDSDLPGISDLFWRVKPFRDALIVYWMNIETTLDDMVNSVSKASTQEVKEKMRHLTGMSDGKLTTDPDIVDNGFALLNKLLDTTEDDNTTAEVYATKAYMLWVLGEDSEALENAAKATNVNPDQTLAALIIMALGCGKRFRNLKF